MLNGTSLQVNFRTDSAGCGNYRIKFINDTVPSVIKRNYRFMDCESPFRDETFLKYTDAVRLQRLYNPVYLSYFNWLKEKSSEYGFKIIIDYDDILTFNDIPAWNNCRAASFGCDSAISSYLDGADILTFPNKRMLDFYVTRFKLPSSKCFVINNYIPKWWYGFAYDENRSLLNLKQDKKKITFCCSTSHFDMYNINNGNDDFTNIIPWIIDNINNYQFCFQGGLPRQLIPYKDKLILYAGVPVLYYPLARVSSNTNLYIQPLNKCQFNNVKSTIKVQEAWAEGVPVLTQDTDNYLDINSSFCFSDANSLDSLVRSVFSSQDVYMDIIKCNKQRSEMYWLEDNLSKWLSIMKR